MKEWTSKDAFDEIREATYRWMMGYHEQRPDDSLDDLMPLGYLSENAHHPIFNCLPDGEADAGTSGSGRPFNRVRHDKPL